MRAVNLEGKLALIKEPWPHVVGTVNDSAVKLVHHHSCGLDHCPVAVLPRL